MAAFFSLSALAACAPSHPDEVAFRVAGASATYCNLANEGAPEAVAPCAIEAWREGRPFVVRQTPRGIDSEVFEYFVSAGGGRVQKLSSDRLIARPGVAGYLRVTAQECTNVRVERVDGADTLACDAAGPLQCIEGC